MYRFRLCIGDWSGDGHGYHEYFTVSSNVPVEIVREAHYMIKDVTGVDIEKICSEYGEYAVNEEIIATLKGMGFEFEEGIASVPEMAQLWIFLLQKANQALQLEIVDEDIPTLHFYGFDDKKRHINFVGYGLFDNY